jgi:hypothetical protein
LRQERKNTVNILKIPKQAERTNERAKEKNLLKKKKIRKDDTVRLGSCLVQHFKKHAKERERPQNKLEKSYFLICFIEQV